MKNALVVPTSAILALLVTACSMGDTSGNESSSGPSAVTSKQDPGSTQSASAPESAVPPLPTLEYPTKSPEPFDPNRPMPGLEQTNKSGPFLAPIPIERRVRLPRPSQIPKLPGDSPGGRSLDSLSTSPSLADLDAAATAGFSRDDGEAFAFTLLAALLNRVDDPLVADDLRPYFTETFDEAQSVDVGNVLEMADLGLHMKVGVRAYVRSSEPVDPNDRMQVQVVSRFGGPDTETLPWNFDTMLIHRQGDAWVCSGITRVAGFRTESVDDRMWVGEMNSGKDWRRVLITS